MRDLLLGRPATDFDLVVEGDAISFVRSLSASYGGKVTSHNRFGTATWNLDSGTLAGLNIPASEHAGVLTLDFASSRSEIYKHPAALPTIKPGTLTDDLRRRDFSINTLALRLDGSHFGDLRDELGGLDDLHKGLVRVLHPHSFIDDPTRLFRAVRYADRYGFQIAPETLALIPAALPGIHLLSAERVRHELDLILDEKNVIAMLTRLNELDLLRPLRPLILNRSAVSNLERGFLGMAQTEIRSINVRREAGFLGWHFWLMDCSQTDIKTIEERMHFHANLFRSLLAASTLRADAAFLVRSNPSACVKRLEGLPLTAVCAVYFASPEGKLHQNLQDYLETWRHIRAKTTGHDLIKRGLTPGPEYRSILWKLRAAWLDGEVKTHGEEKTLLDKLIKRV